MPLDVRPEDVMARLTMQIEAPAMRVYPVQYAPKPVPSSLYGVLIEVVGEGVIGQYISHSEYYLEVPQREEYWDIWYGIVVVYSRCIEEGALAFIPTVVHGLPVPDIDRLVSDCDLFEHVSIRGKVTVPKKALVNLQDVMAGRSPVLRVDPYGLTVTEDAREKIVSLSKQLIQVSKAYSSLVREYEACASARRIAEEQLVGIKQLYDDLKARLITTQGSLQAAETALQDYFARLSAVRERVATERELREELEALTRDMTSSIELARRALATARAAIAEVIEEKEEAERQPAEQKSEAKEAREVKEEKEEEEEEGGE